MAEQQPCGKNPEGDCAVCGADWFMECPYEGLDPSLLNIKPTVCVLGEASDNQECLACQ